MINSSLDRSSSKNPFKDLDLDSCRETIRFASKEALTEIVLQLSDDQYEYAKTTLPSKKANELENAWNLARVKALKA